MTDFYDQMAGLYHLIFQDWEESMERQARQLASIIEERWEAAPRTVLDVSCGIGTQSIGLAKCGFAVTASDLSPGAIARARDEARRRAVEVEFSVCDMREAYFHHKSRFGVVISVDNSITHLLNDDDLLLALRQLYACTLPGGGCLLTVRDYEREERGSGIVRPYGVREEEKMRYIIFQVWDFAGQVYDLSMYVVADDRMTGHATTYVMRTRYNAVSTSRLLTLMQRAGFTSVERLDNRFYQPVLVGNRKT
jgi:SAM-dependent methyltransferase